MAVRGPSVFAGYERNADANNESFSDGWFRTGDEGFLDEDGYLFLRGRLKEVINRGGEKVSPREFEDALLAHPSVAETVVFAQKHARLGEAVAAAVVVRNGASGSSREIQEFALTRLAPYKVPATVVFLDELPKGPTGKVQRVGLAERLGLPPLGGSDSVRPPYAPPRTELEEQLCAIWGELLGIERVGIHDDFIALGGDSLLVAQLLAQVAELRAARPGADEELPACAILWAPTIERFAAVLERGWDATGGAMSVEPGRPGSPFFFLPTHDWGTVGVGALGRRLVGEYALYTAQLDPELGATDVPDVEALAALVLRDIRTAQPEGPYALGGICFGGGVALEVGRALEAEGEQVTLVLVNPIGERPNRVRHVLRWTRLQARNGSLRSWLGRRLPRPGPRDLPGASASAPELERALRGASRAYRARPYTGRVAVLAGANYTTPKEFWDGIAVDGLDWRHLPNGGMAIFRAHHLDALAVELGDVLAGH